MKFYFVLIYLLFSISFFAQENTFKKIYGHSNILSLSINNENEYLLSGSIPLPYEYTPKGIFIIKADKFGDTIWTKTFDDGAAKKTMHASVSLIDEDNNLIIGGPLNTLLPRGMTPTKIVLTKINPQGDSLWWKEFGDGNSNQSVSSMIQDDDNFILAGNKINSQGFNQGFILKVDPNGDSIYSKYYSIGEYGSTFRSIEKTNDNQYIILGRKTITPPVSDERTKYFVLKIDSNGDTIFTKIYGPENSVFSVSNLHPIKSDEYVFLLYTYTYTQPADKYTSLIKLDSNGEIISEQRLNIVASLITPTLDGNFIVANTSVITAKTKNINLTKYDAAGDVLWERSITFTDADDLTASVIKETPDSGIVLSGSVSINNYPHAFLVKTNHEGVVVNVNVTEDIISGHYLNNNYPNPFNPVTTIKYQIPENEFVTIKVYDVLGKEIETLVNEPKPPGTYEVEFSVGSFGNAHSLTSGVYIYTLKAGDFISSKKMILLR
jgi:hypothetical protein